MTDSPNLIPNGNFRIGEIGGLPDGWKVNSVYPNLTPVFRLEQRGTKKALLATGGGNEDCYGWLSSDFVLPAGKTYRLKALFEMSEDLNPHKNLMFTVEWGAFHDEHEYNAGIAYNNGIFDFRRLGGSLVEGENKFFLEGDGLAKVNARVYFRWNADGKAWIHELSMEGCEPIQPRYARFACTGGRGDMATWTKVLDEAGKAGVDLVLLPETFNGVVPEAIDGPSATLMSTKAREYEMYVAGTFVYLDKAADRVYNAAVLYDRVGKLADMYYKHHPYTCEILQEGVVRGTEIPVFDTDFGKLGFIICSDAWYPDVSELLALKGAEIILFPSAGFYRSLMPARSSDNRVRIIASSRNTGHGMWDSTGGEIANPYAEELSYSGSTPMFSNVETRPVDNAEILFATFDLSQRNPPANYGGPIISAPGGLRNRREEKNSLYGEIEREVNRWWIE